MKLRIHGNSLRLRLNQAEVAQFSKTGHIDDSVEFGAGASLGYILESTTRVDSPQAIFKNGEIRIQLPIATAKEWVTTDRVGVSADQPVAGGKHLAIAIEKDFKCIHSDHADPNAYPNPLAAEARD